MHCHGNAHRGGRRIGLTDAVPAWSRHRDQDGGSGMTEIFDEDLFVKGLEQRKATLGAEYVEKNLAAADDFTRPFQEAMTAWCWGFGWGDEVIPAKTRSMMNLAMIGALGKMHEWEIHCRGAITNGVSKEEIRAIIHVIGIYCGVPQALECFRVARKVLDEQP
jgi:4-carboxymuconolactone decarboxylase